jgi:hypothetical protein
VKRFECVGLNAPLVEPGLDCVEVGLELLGGCGGVTVRGENGCVVSKGGDGCFLTAFHFLNFLLFPIILLIIKILYSVSFYLTAQAIVLQG